jgi:hypothetical protein
LSKKLSSDYDANCFGINNQFRNELALVAPVWVPSDNCLCASRRAAIDRKSAGRSSWVCNRMRDYGLVQL